jgi:hypothetical protein
MLKRIFFKLVDFWIFFKKRNWNVIEQDAYTDGTPYTRYIYNGKEYTRVGEFPYKHNGFSLPIQSVIVDGVDHTHTVKMYTGPVGNTIPDAGYIFHALQYTPEMSYEYGKFNLTFKAQRVKGPSRTVVVKNILGHETTVQSDTGAR